MFEWIPTIETERLILRERSPDIVKRIFEDYDKDAQMIFFNFESEKDLETEKERFKKGYSSWHLTFKTWDIIEKLSFKNIGFCGFHAWYLRHDKAEIGYALNNDESKRKGYMSEAVTPIIKHGFEEMNLHRIEAYVGTSNIPSTKIVEKHHFQYEGHIKEDYLRDGIYEDSLVYGLLTSAYKKRKP